MCPAHRQPSIIKAIFWDNDGVLVETEHLYFKATQDVLASIGIDLTEADYNQLFLVQGRGAWHLAGERGVSAGEIERLRDQRNARYAEWLASTPALTAGIAEVLAALHGRYVMGVVTSSRKDHFDLIHRASGLLKYFDFVLTANDFTQLKPDPEPYRRAVERSGCDAVACVAIEDSERGLTSAKAAGIGCIVVPTSLTARGNFEKADRILGSISEILEVPDPVQSQQRPRPHSSSSPRVGILTAPDGRLVSVAVIIADSRAAAETRAALMAGVARATIQHYR